MRRRRRAVAARIGGHSAFDMIGQCLSLRALEYRHWSRRRGARTVGREFSALIRKFSHAQVAFECRTAQPNFAELVELFDNQIAVKKRLLLSQSSLE